MAPPSSTALFSSMAFLVISAMAHSPLPAPSSAPTPHSDAVKPPMYAPPPSKNAPQPSAPSPETAGATPPTAASSSPMTPSRSPSVWLPPAGAPAPAVSAAGFNRIEVAASLAVGLFAAVLAM